MKRNSFNSPRNGGEQEDNRRPNNWPTINRPSTNETMSRRRCASTISSTATQHAVIVDPRTAAVLGLTHRNLSSMAASLFQRDEVNDHKPQHIHTEWTMANPTAALATPPTTLGKYSASIPFLRHPKFLTGKYAGDAGSGFDPLEGLLPVLNSWFIIERRRSSMLGLLCW
jgi:hypothetical protein